jgi:hypothetical protein
MYGELVEAITKRLHGVLNSYDRPVYSSDFSKFYFA